MKTKGIGITHGKAILMGEHSVVYGEPCIAIPLLSLQVKAKVEKAAIGTLDCNLYSGPIQSLPESLKNIQVAIQTSCQKCGISFPLSVEIQSDLPQERGMGSSAAVAGAIIKAIFDLAEKPLFEETLCLFINEAEKITHGRPSGIDAIATTHSYACYFIKEKALEILPLSLDADLIVADTGILGNTKEAVQWVKEHYQEKNYQEAIQKLGKLTKEAKKEIQDSNVPALGQLLTAAQKELKEIGVSHPALEHLIHLANQYGAYGSKLTGGGRGGCMIALCPPEKTKIICQHLQKEAKYVWHFHLKE